MTSPAADVHTTSVARLPRNKNAPPRASPEKQDGEGEDDEAKDGATPKVRADDAGEASSSRGGQREGSSAGSTGGNGRSGSSDDGGDDAAPPSERGTSSSSLVSRNTVPAVYPQVLALPITRRPLFPGFYKAVVIKNPQVCAAIKEAMKRGQPYVGAFLLKDEEEDSDVITSLDRVHKVGVFAQITSIFPAQTSGKDAKGEEEGITAVLYPHRRIRIDELITPMPEGAGHAAVRVADAEAARDAPSSEREHGVVDGAGADAAPSSNATTSTEAPSEARVAEQRDAEVGTDRGATRGTSDVRPDPAEDRVADDVALTDRRPTGEDVVADDVAVERPGAMPSHSVPFQTSFLHNYEVSLVNVSNLEMEPYDKKPNQYIRAVMSELISVFKDIANLNPLFRDQIANFSISQGAGNVFEEPEKLADFAAAVSSSEVDELQGVLQSMNVEDRLQKALLVLKKELMNAQLQSKISKDVESKIQKRQREYYLMEQLKGIKKELGLESDGKDKMVEKFKEKASQLRMPEAVRKVFDEELNKLQTLEPAASEFNVTRGYLDWLTHIPWGVHSPENYAIKHATQVLDEDHYGLNDVKDRILEFLAIGKLRGTVQGKILCLVGPPGVGKTSIGKSIARALDRQFFRFSVGGLSDVAEIKGHRRTYVGAMPGKAIQALKKVGTENPLILIDEVDKVGRGYNGDPSSALLEMLDPEQNASFMDHYLDVPVDLSRVLFVCTANTLETIPQPLLDRMEVIEVSSYTAEEKRYIARDYLAPQAKEASGLRDADIVLPDASIDFLIKKYARESGVRGLRKLLEKVYRKVAFDIVKEHGEEVFPEPSSDSAQRASPAEDAYAPAEDAHVKVTTQPRAPMAVPPSVHVELTPALLQRYLGPPVYQQDRLYTDTMPAGVALGLGYLGNGAGSLMPVETTLMPGKGRLQLTGKLGEVIKESASIALSWIKTHAYELGLTSDAGESLLEHRDVHVHMPEGAVGKEGPSAGVAFCTSLISLLTGRALPTTLAMTGEVSLHGMVMPVGGLKEKLLAAHRANVRTVLLPAANQPSVEADVPKSVLDDLDVHYVNNVWSALQIALGDGPWTARAAAAPAAPPAEPAAAPAAAPAAPASTP
ncbi:endopeptidase La [Malassezia brasiliensis]|uniref:Lon protease homolog, mitochondrial n=1 Tax=Malassezia brasiliensis TaxID=1821822 RepID=A0AAF0DV11_9BASI|nr:endopeptidase La [Malassezia brasiliensis]